MAALAAGAYGLSTEPSEDDQRKMKKKDPTQVRQQKVHDNSIQRFEVCRRD
jgi:hypothetical protein